MEELKYKTGLKRLGAAIIDGIVFTPFMFMEHWLFSKTEDLVIKISWTLFVLILSLSYSILLHYKYGQTIGKWVTDLKVVDISETKSITLKQSLLRDSFYIITEIAALVYFAFLFFTTNQSETLFEEYRNFSNYPATIWGVLEIISLATNAKRRAIHDFLANTVVVRVS